MSAVATRFQEFANAIGDACERMVSASIVGDLKRREQRRLIGVALAAPFLAAGAVLPSMAVHLGAGAILAMMLAAFGTSWLVALSVASTGKIRGPAVLALIAAGIGLVGALQVSGGLSSPIAAFGVAIVVEACWIGGRRAVPAAVAAVVAAVLAQAIMLFFSPVQVAPSGWQWLAPLAWLGTLWWRAAGFQSLGNTQDASEALPRAEDLLDVVVFRLARDGEVLEASPKARSILNLRPDLLTGSGLFDRIHLSDRVSYLSALADLREGQPAQRLELRIRMPGNGQQTAADNYRPFLLEMLREEEGETFTIILRNNEDIAALRASLAAARELADKAETTKGRFLAAVSHELRTPLNAIIGFSDMLLAEMVGGFRDPRQKEYITLVRDSGQHLLDVVTAILDVSKIEAGTYAAQPEPFRFADTVERVHAMMRMQAEARQLEFSMRIPGDCGEINADRRAIQQMLINLVSNAIKFTPEHGSVEIGAQRVGTHLHFWVSDTGIGIAEQDLARLGRPFTQVQNDYTRRFEGTGLGLSLVKGLVELHQGTMSIESAPGLGTKVAISLPVLGPKPDEKRGVIFPLPSGKASKEDGNAPFRKTA